MGNKGVFFPGENLDFLSVLSERAGVSELAARQVQLVSQLGQMGGSGAEEKECRRKLEQLKLQEDSLRAAIQCEDSI